MTGRLLYNAVVVALFLLSSSFMVAHGAAPASGPTWPAQLQTQVARIARDFEGELGVYVKDLSTEATYGFNATAPLYLASTIKVPVLIAVYREMARGRLYLDEYIEVRPEDRRDGSPVLREADGNAFTLGQLVRVMMTRSDNGATDLVIRRVGIENVAAAIGETGIQGFRQITTMLDVRRHIYGGVDPAAASLTPEQYVELRESDSAPNGGKLLAKMLGRDKPFPRKAIEDAFDAYYATELNSAPMESMGALLELMARGKLVSAEASREMLQVMKTCETGKQRLRALIPAEVELAHKTGTQYRRACDVGVMYVRKDRPVVIAVCAKNSPLAPAERAIARVGKAAYDAIVADGWRPQAAAEPRGEPPGEPRAETRAETFVR